MFGCLCVVVWVGCVLLLYGVCGGVGVGGGGGGVNRCARWQNHPRRRARMRYKPPQIAAVIDKCAKRFRRFIVPDVGGPAARVHNVPPCGLQGRSHGLVARRVVRVIAASIYLDLILGAGKKKAGRQSQRGGREPAQGALAADLHSPHPKTQMWRRRAPRCWQRQGTRRRSRCSLRCRLRSSGFWSGRSRPAPSCQRGSAQYPQTTGGLQGPARGACSPSSRPLHLVRGNKKSVGESINKTRKTHIRSQL